MQKQSKSTSFNLWMLNTFPKFSIIRDDETSTLFSGVFDRDVESSKQENNRSRTQCLLEYQRRGGSKMIFSGVFDRDVESSKQENNRSRTQCLLEYQRRGGSKMIFSGVFDRDEEVVR